MPGARAVFISYTRADKPVAKALADALTNAGINVWSDDELLAGEKFHKRITGVMSEVDAAVVVWSKASLDSDWVCAEAEYARQRKKLLQIRIDACELFIPFTNIHCQDLIGWNGDTNAVDFEKLVKAVEKHARRDEQSVPSNDPEIEAIDKLLADSLKIRIKKQIAEGDLSTVYLASDQWRQYVVKVLPGSMSADDSIRDELVKTSLLNNPSFMRIIDVAPKGKSTVVLADYVPAETLSAVLHARNATADAQNGATGINAGTTTTRNQPLFRLEQVVDMMRQLSEALHEAHFRGLRYVRVTPREIYLLEDGATGQIRPILAPINFDYRSVLTKGKIDFTPERGPYTAPELMSGGAPLGRPDWKELLQKADQFSLGMIALTLLEGRVPFDTSMAHETEFDTMERFRDTARGRTSEGKQVQSFEDMVLSARWKLKARALARIVARMLRFNAGQRWASMKQVSQLFAALDADLDGEHLRNIVKKMYANYCRGPDRIIKREFYQRFYDRLFEQDPVAGRIFKDRRIDIQGQYDKLDAALHQLLNYNQAQDEPTPLTGLLERHARMEIGKSNHRRFGEVLCETFASFLEPDDPEREMKLAALDVVVWPAVYYFVDQTELEEAVID